MKNKNIRKFVLLSVLTALTIYILNRIVFYLATINDLLNSNNGEYFDWRFGKVYYTTRGKGSPILLIHDLNEKSSAYEWNRIVEELSKTNTVYTMDLLGCGRSEKPNITYTNYLYVQLISDFIKTIIKHKTNVIATGISSSFVIMSCNVEPDIYEKIMMINPISLKVLSQVPSKRTKTLKLLINTPIVGTLVYNMLTTKKSIRNAFSESYLYKLDKIKDQDIEVYYEAAHRSGVDSKYLLSSMKGRYININICHALKQIDNSLIILGGGNFPFIAETAEEYTQCNSAIEVEYINNTKYLPQLESPDKILEQINIFFYK